MMVTVEVDAREYLAEMLQKKYRFTRLEAYTFSYEISEAAVRILLADEGVSVTGGARRHAR